MKLENLLRIETMYSGCWMVHGGEALFFYLYSMSWQNRNWALTALFMRFFGLNQAARPTDRRRNTTNITKYARRMKMTTRNFWSHVYIGHTVTVCKFAECCMCIVFCSACQVAINRRRSTCLLHGTDYRLCTYVRQPNTYADFDGLFADLGNNGVSSYLHMEQCTLQRRKTRGGLWFFHWSVRVSLFEFWLFGIITVELNILPKSANQRRQEPM